MTIDDSLDFAFAGPTVFLQSGNREPSPPCRLQGAFHPMMGTVLMLFFGLPVMTRSL